MSLISKDGNSCYTNTCTQFLNKTCELRKLRKSETVYFFNTQKKLDFKLFVGQLLLLCHHHAVYIIWNKDKTWIFFRYVRKLIGGVK